MKATLDDRARTEAFERATAHSVFLRAAIERWPRIATSFLEHGASAAAVTRSRWRSRLAISPGNFRSRT